MKSIEISRTAGYLNLFSRHADRQTDIRISSPCRQTDRPKKKNKRQLCQRSCITSHLRSVWHIRNSSTSWCRRRCRRLRKQIPGGIFLCLLRFSYIIVKEKHQQQHRKPKIVPAKWNEFWRVLSLKPKKNISYREDPSNRTGERHAFDSRFFLPVLVRLLQSLWKI